MKSFLSRHVFPNQGFPGGARDKEAACQWRRLRRGGFDPWLEKIPWRRAWQPLQYSCPENPHGQRSLEGYSPQGLKEEGMTEVT